MTSKYVSLGIAALAAFMVSLRAAATRVRIHVQGRRLRKAGWSWYEADRRDRPLTSPFGEQDERR